MTSAGVEVSDAGGFYFCAGVGVAAMSFAAEGVSLQGVFVSQQEVLFCLKNGDSGVSAWVKIGGAFDGFEVTRYAAETGTLTLEKGGKETQLVLRDAAIAASKPTLPVTPIAELRLAIGSNKKFEEVVAIAEAHGRVLTPLHENENILTYILAPPGTVVDRTKPISAPIMLLFYTPSSEHRRTLLIR